MRLPNGRRGRESAKTSAQSRNATNGRTLPRLKTCNAPATSSIVSLSKSFTRIAGCLLQCVIKNRLRRAVASDVIGAQVNRHDGETCVAECRLGVAQIHAGIERLVRMAVAQPAGTRWREVARGAGQLGGAGVMPRA